MVNTPEAQQELRDAFQRMVAGGMGFDLAAPGLSCALELLATLDRYGAAGLAGFGAVLGLLDQLGAPAAVLSQASRLLQEAR